jgi:hypothetical protein
VSGVLSTAVRAGIISGKYASKAIARAIPQLKKSGANPQALKALQELRPDDHLGALKGFVQEQFGIAPNAYGDSNVDFEKLFALVDAELLGYHGLLHLRGEIPHGPSSSDVLEMEFMLVLCGSIVAATRNLTCDYHDRMASWLNKGDLVASFNYDLLMDRSLRRCLRWFPDTGYALRFSKIGRRTGDDVEWRDPLTTPSDAILLKPHGSLNWLHPIDSWDSVAHMNLHGRTSRQAQERLFCLEDINPRFEDDHPTYEWWERYDHTDNDYTFDMHSIVVPPTLSKPYRDYEPMIGSQWAHLFRALLHEAHELYLVGYSIRPDDVRSWWLFRKIAVSSETLERVVVVDPSDDVFARAKAVFSPRRVERGALSLADFSAGL